MPFLKARDIVLGKKTATGVEIPLPGAPLVLVVAKKGYLMCGYLNIAAAEKFGACAAVVTGVQTTDDLLNGSVKVVTSKAMSLGIKPGMSGRAALKKLL